MKKRNEIAYRPAWQPQPSRYVGGRFDPGRDTVGMVLNHLRSYVPDDVMEFARKLDEFHGVGQAKTDRMFEPIPLTFGPNDPTCFWDEEGDRAFRGNENAKRRVDLEIRTLKPGERCKALLVGGAGTGKTTFAFLFAHRLFDHLAMHGIAPGNFYQIMSTQIDSKEKLDVFMGEIPPNSFVFIDEIHTLVKHLGVEVLLHVLQDTAIPRYPLQDGSWLEISPTISWVGATTDPGEMDNTTGGALIRRLNPPPIRMEYPGVEEIKQIIIDQGYPIHPDAAWDAARRCTGLPYMAVQVQNQMRKVALDRGEDLITPPAAVEAFKNLGLDERGTTIEDRLVMKALMQNPRTLRSGEKRYAMSEGALCATTGIDSGTYRTDVQPRLFKLGLLTVLSGQCLTEKALAMYGFLGVEE